jgi:phosphoserine phosphatase
VVDGCHLKFVEVLELWKNANAVCFDVDSTVCLDEGIDELAEFCGAGKAVAEWTSRFDVSHSLELFNWFAISLYA